MTDKKDGSDLFDMVDRAISLYEQNKNSIQGLTGGDGDINLGDDDILKQASVTDSAVNITVDVGVEDLEDIRLALNGKEAQITVGGEKITAEVPSDVNMDRASAHLNNGVLEVAIPREGGNE